MHMLPDITIRPAIKSDQQIWDSLVDHPMQSWAWGEFRRELGVDVVRVIECVAGKPTIPWQLTFHKIPYTPWSIGYFPKGPMPTDTMIEYLKVLGKQKNAIYIQFEPNVIAADSRQLAADSSLISSHHPLFTKYTFVLDLTKSESDMLAAMHTKTRYNIKVAQKHDVKIQEDNSAAAFAAYLQLTAQTTNRQGFYAHTSRYHKSMLEILAKAGIAKLFTATYEGEILATWILFIWKDTIYYPYGASSRNHRETMAPHLLLWEIVRWGKSQGYKKFDLWGAMGPSPDEHDPWYGFHRFKAGFAPTHIEFIGSYDLVCNLFLYQKYVIADRIRWSLLKLGKK